jgi:hypothetical protein
VTDDETLRFERALGELADQGLADGVGSSLSALTAEIDRELDGMYAGKFPKRCNTCGRVFHDHAEYMASTRALRGGALFDEDDREVHEYRDCPCGSSLLVLVGDRRDETPFGQRRRRLFDAWLARIARESGRAPDEIAPWLRGVFRAALVRARDAPATS